MCTHTHNKNGASTIMIIIEDINTGNELVIELPLKPNQEAAIKQALSSNHQTVYTQNEEECKVLDKIVESMNGDRLIIVEEWFNSVDNDILAKLLNPHQRPALHNRHNPSSYSGKWDDEITLVTNISYNDKFKHLEE
jgi:hypothetical protein